MWIARFAGAQVDTVRHGDRDGLHAVTKDGIEVMARLATAQERCHGFEMRRVHTGLRN